MRRNLDWGDEVRVTSDERAFSDRTAGLLIAIVVHHDRTTAEVHTGTDVSIADISEMSRFRARAERRVFDLDVVPDFHAGTKAATRSQMSRRANDDVVVEMAVFDHASRLDVHALA